MRLRKIWQRAALAGAALATTSCFPPGAARLGAAASIATPRLAVDLAALLGDDRVLASFTAPRFVLPAAASFRLSYDHADNRQRALNCLTAAAYYEGRSETEEGQRAIVQVVLNRVRHYAYPSTICGVVFQGSDRPTGCQFSFTCDGSLDRPRELEAWRRAERIAQEAIDGYVYAPVGWATHYHRYDVRPGWASSLRALPLIGVHQFYAWQGGAGEAKAFVRRSSSLEQQPGRPLRHAAAVPAAAPAPHVAQPPRPLVAAGAEASPAHQAAAGVAAVRSAEPGAPGFDAGYTPEAG
jgi:hypothetical protein